MSSAALSFVDEIHEQAIQAALNYRRSVADLIEILQKVERHRVYIAKDHTSVFNYAVEELKLPRSVAYGLIRVARKACEVPELLSKLRTEELQISNVEAISSVVSKGNAEEWLDKAQRLSLSQSRPACNSRGNTFRYGR